MDNYSEGLATGMALHQGNPGYGNGGFGFGGEWGGLIGLLIVASLFGGNGWASVETEEVTWQAMKSVD